MKAEQVKKLLDACVHCLCWVDDDLTIPSGDKLIRVLDELKEAQKKTRINKLKRQKQTLETELYDLERQ